MLLLRVGLSGFGFFLYFFLYEFQVQTDGGHTVENAAKFRRNRSKNLPLSFESWSFQEQEI